MAKSVLRNAAIVITVNGTAYDLSDHCSSVNLTNEATEVDVTTFGTSLFTASLQGMKTAAIEAEFFNDYVPGSVDTCLSTCYASSTAFVVDVWANGTTTGTANPKFSLPAATSYSYNPITGAVGDANATGAVRFTNAGTAGLTRSTT